MTTELTKNVMSGKMHQPHFENLRQMTRSYFPVVNEDGVLPRMLFLLFVKGRDDCPKELARELDLWLGGSLIVHSNNASHRHGNGRPGYSPSMRKIPASDSTTWNVFMFSAAGPAFAFPVITSNCEPCHGHCTVPQIIDPPAREAPRCGQRSSNAA